MSEIDRLVDEFERRLGAGHGLTIQTHVVTSDGERVIARWRRSGAGFEGERLAVGYSITDVLRKAAFMEDEWDQAEAERARTAGGIP